MYNSLKISQDEAEATKPNFPNISINIIDSDNICMCLCAHLSSNNLQFDDSRTGEAICPMCRNIIKRQPVAHRYKLLSKRLMLTQEIIINRIDTQHLSTDSERLYEDPYTPESTESHSPYPEVTSSCTSTSSSSRSPLDRRLMPHSRVSESKVGESETISPGPETGSSDISEKPPRGTVTPGQLKSRLETLKRLSIKDEKDEKDDDEDETVVDDEAGGAGDVDQVDAVGPPIAAAAAATAPPRSKRSSSVIPMCCTIH